MLVLAQVEWPIRESLPLEKLSRSLRKDVTALGDAGYGAITGVCYSGVSLPARTPYT